MAERDAGSCFGVFLESRQTTAPSGVLFRLAIGVGSARQSLARVNATALDAGQLPVTVIVGLAFGSSFPLTSILEIQFNKSIIINHLVNLVRNSIKTPVR